MILNLIWMATHGKTCVIPWRPTHVETPFTFHSIRKENIWLYNKYKQGELDG